MPLNEDGSFHEISILGKPYKGKELFDMVDKVVRAAYYEDKDENTATMREISSGFVVRPLCPSFRQG